MGIRDRQQFKNEQVNEGRTPQTGAGHDRGVARLPTEGNHVQVSKAVVILRGGGLQNGKIACLKLFAPPPPPFFFIKSGNFLCPHFNMART